MYNKNQNQQDRKRVRYSEFQNSFLHDNQKNEEQHKRPKLDIQFNARNYEETSMQQNRRTAQHSHITNLGTVQKSNAESKFNTNRLLTTKSLSANALQPNKAVTRSETLYTNRIGTIFSSSRESSNVTESYNLVDFGRSNSDVVRNKINAKAECLSNTATVSATAGAGKSVGSGVQNDDIWGEDLDEVTIEECMLLATQASQSCVPDVPTTLQAPEAKKLNNSDTIRSVFNSNLTGRSRFNQQNRWLPKVRQTDGSENTTDTQQSEIRNPHPKEHLFHSAVEKKNDLIQELQKLRLENQQLKGNILTKEGEVSILRTQLNDAKSEIETQKQEKLKAVESQSKELNEKLQAIEKELQQAKTQLEFKNIETESIQERQKWIKSKKKVKLVAPEPANTALNSTSTSSFKDRSTFVDHPVTAQKQVRRGQDLRKISQGSRFGHQVSSLFEKVPKKAHSITNVYSVNTTPDFSDDKMAYLTPQAVTINAAYTGINQLFLLDSFEDEKSQPLIKWVVWECFKVLICQLALLEAHGTVQSMKHRTSLNEKVLSSAGILVGNYPSLTSARPWHELEQGIETRRALGVLSAIASISEKAATYMLGSIEPIESYNMKKWEWQSPLKNEMEISNGSSIYSSERRNVFQQTLYKTYPSTEDALSKNSLNQQDTLQYCSKRELKSLRINLKWNTNSENDSKNLHKVTKNKSNSNIIIDPKPGTSKDSDTVEIKVSEKIIVPERSAKARNTMQEQSSCSSNRLKTFFANYNWFKFLPLKNKAFIKQLEMMKEPAIKEHSKRDAVPEELESSALKNKPDEPELKLKEHTIATDLHKTNKGEDLLQVLYSLVRCICDQRLSLYFCGVLCAIVLLLKGIASKTHIGQERHALIGMLLKELVFCLPCVNVLVEMTALLCWLGRYDQIMKSFCNWTGQANETRRMYDIKTFPKTKCTLQLFSLLLRLRKASFRQYVELADNLTRWLICIGNDATAEEPSWISIPAAKPNETPPKICPCRTHIMDATIMLLYTCYEYLQKTGFDKNNHLYPLASKLPGRGMVLLYRLLGRVRDFEVFINRSEGEYELLLKGIEQNAAHLPLSEEEEEAFKWLLEVEADHWSQISTVPASSKASMVSKSTCSFILSQMS